MIVVGSLLKIERKKRSRFVFSDLSETYSSHAKNRLIINISRPDSDWSDPTLRKIYHNFNPPRLSFFMPFNAIPSMVSVTEFLEAAQKERSLQGKGHSQPRTLKNGNQKYLMKHNWIVIMKLLGNPSTKELQMHSPWQRCKFMSEIFLSAMHRGRIWKEIGFEWRQKGWKETSKSHRICATFNGFIKAQC